MKNAGNGENEIWNLLSLVRARGKNLCHYTCEHVREIVMRFVSSGSFISNIHRASGSFTSAISKFWKVHHWSQRHRRSVDHWCPWHWHTVNLPSVSLMRREIITVRGQSYASRLPKYWPPTPLSARRVCTVYPTPLFGGRRHSPGGEGGGGSILWKTRGIGLPSYSNNISTHWCHASGRQPVLIF